jgi:hypothetical protein
MRRSRRAGKIEGTTLQITPALATLERDQNKYLANLPIWGQFVVFTYTLGSQAVNRRLTGLPLIGPDTSRGRPGPLAGGENLGQKWTFELFQNFTYGLDNLGGYFKQWTRFFKNPSLYLKLDNQQREEIAEKALDLYSRDLQSIILKAPVTTEDIIVYKASTPYDERLLSNTFPFTIPQKPFNSTTYDPWFDFNAFLGSNKDSCCLWEILIPQGSHVLAITHPFQAYLTEREIILPIGSSFEVINAGEVVMSYWAQREAPIKTQKKPPYRIGELYRHDHMINGILVKSY